MYFIGPRGVHEDSETHAKRLQHNQRMRFNRQISGLFGLNLDFIGTVYVLLCVYKFKSLFQYHSHLEQYNLTCSLLRGSAPPEIMKLIEAKKGQTRGILGEI